MRPITDLYEPLPEDASGPGCPHPDHGDGCLCDVDLEAHPVPPNGDTYESFIASHAARVIGGVPRTPAAVAAWAAEMGGLADAIADRCAALGTTPDELEASRDLYAQRRGQGWEGGPQHCLAPVRQLLRSGLTFHGVANLVCAPLTEVVSVMAKQRVTTQETGAWVDAERMLRAGAQSYRAVAEATGLHFERVRRLADVVGVRSGASQRRLGGGGWKYTRQQIDDVLALRVDGKTYGQISKTTGVGREAVRKIIARSGAQS